MFDDLLDIPPPVGFPSKPIIDLAEDADTVRRFLSAVDPTTLGLLPSLPLQQTQDLFLLAVKYQIDWVASHMERNLFGHAATVKDLELFEFTPSPSPSSPEEFERTELGDVP